MNVCFLMVFRGYFHLAPSNLDLNASNLGRMTWSDWFDEGFTGRGLLHYKHSCRCTFCLNSEIWGISWFLLWRTLWLCLDQIVIILPYITTQTANVVPAHRCESRGTKIPWGCPPCAMLCTQSAGIKGKKQKKNKSPGLWGKPAVMHLFILPFTWFKFISVFFPSIFPAFFKYLMNRSFQLTKRWVTNESERDPYVYTWKWKPC